MQDARLVTKTHPTAARPYTTAALSNAFSRRS
jgi:hypothetical protein